MLKYYWNRFNVDKKFRNRIEYILLSLLFLVLIYSLIVNVLTTSSEEIPDVGAFAAVICPKCNYRDVKKIVNIEDEQNLCPKCSTHLMFIWKCQACAYEYPFIMPKLYKKPGMTTEEVFMSLKEVSKCPNCKSIHTFQATPQIIKDKKK